MNTLELRVRNLLQKDKKVEAVKLVHHSTNWGLRASKEYVDSIESGGTIKMPKFDYSKDELLSEVSQLLSRDNKIGAIKFVTEQTMMGLKEAKEYVESLQLKIK